MILVLLILTILWMTLGGIIVIDCNFPKWVISCFIVESVAIMGLLIYMSIGG